MSPHDGAVGGVDRVRLGRERQVDDGLRQREIALRLAEEVHGVLRGEAEVERLGRGQSNVLHRHAHDAAGNVHGVFAGLQHARQPVERGVHVGVAHGLVQRGDDVVVLLALLVVEQNAALQGLGGNLLGDAMGWFFGGEAGGNIQRVERIARVAAGVGGDGRERVFVGCNA